MKHQEQGRRAKSQRFPIRRRGREPPKPTTASLDEAGVGDDEGHRGWQLHHSSTGQPFYFNRRTGESVWACSTMRASSKSSADNNSDGDTPNTAVEQTTFRRRSQRSASSGSTGSSGSSGSRSSSSSETGPGTLALSSSFSGKQKRPGRVDTSTSDSSDAISTSSASHESSGSTGRSGDDSLSSSSSSSESLDTRSSSEVSWTESMEMRFRRMIASVEGRKMLAEEVKGLTARQARRAQRQRERGATSENKKTRQGRRKLPFSVGRENPQPDEDTDVEMALLGTNTGSKSYSSDSDSSSGSSSDSSGSDSSGSTFSLRLNSGSDGGSDLSLLTSDLVLERLEKVEKALTVARSAAMSVIRVISGLARYAAGVVGRASWWGAIRARTCFLPGGLRSHSSSSFSPTTI